MDTLDRTPGTFYRIFQFIADVLDWVSGLITALIMVVIFVDVLLQISTRVLPIRAFAWTNELGEIMLSALIWIGITAAIKSNNHIGFDLFVSRLSPKGKKFMGIINMALFLLYFILLAYLTKGMMNLYLRRTAYTPILGIGMWWVRLPILVGCVAACARLIIKEFMIITDRERMYESSLLTE